MSKYKVGMKLKRIGGSTYDFSKRVGEVRTVVATRYDGDIILDNGFEREPEYYDRYFKVVKNKIKVGGKLC